MERSAQEPAWIDRHVQLGVGDNPARPGSGWPAWLPRSRSWARLLDLVSEQALERRWFAEFLGLAGVFHDHVPYWPRCDRGPPTVHVAIADQPGLFASAGGTAALDRRREQGGQAFGAAVPAEARRPRTACGLDARAARRVGELLERLLDDILDHAAARHEPSGLTVAD